MEMKRKHKRIEVSLPVKFRPTYGATVYSLGTAINLSSEGFCIRAGDFRFIRYEYLELLFPVTEGPLPLYGDVAWKQQSGKSCIAGVALRMKDILQQKQALEKLCSSAKVPLLHLYSGESGNGRSEVHAGPSGRLAYNTFPVLPKKLGIIKQYHEGTDRCTVTFRLPREIAGTARHVAIAGDFNSWEPARSPMRRLENGDFVLSIDLDTRREYRFRYLIDGTRWENDWYADRYQRNVFGSKDSVVIV